MHYFSFLRSEIVLAYVVRRRYAIYALASIVALVLSGSLAIQPQQWRIVLFGLDKDQTQFVQQALEGFPNIGFASDPAAVADPQAMNRHGALWGISKENGDYAVTRNFGADDAGLAPITYLIVAALQKDAEGPALKDIVTLDLYLRNNGHVGSLPRTMALAPMKSWTFLPKITALIVAFIPFFLAIDMVTKDAQSRALLVSLAGRHGSLVSYALAKLTLCVAFAGCLLFLLLLAAEQFYGLVPKPGLPSLLLTQLAAATVSAGYGVITALLTGAARQAYGAVAAYFLALIVFSGFFFPLETAAPYIQTLSAASPLKYSLPLLENWLLRGQLPTAALGDVVGVVALAVVSVAATSAVAAWRWRTL